MPDDYYVSQYSGEEIDERLTAAHNAVRYDAAQPLTDAQKTQARVNIAAAPDGFGLGLQNVSLTSSDDLDNVRGNGWYYWGSSIPANAPALIHADSQPAYCAMLMIDSSQIVVSGNDRNNMAMRTENIDGWTPWEYLNPPMKLGVEYRTTERYLGKPVYVQAVNFGTLPNANTKSVTWATSGVVLAVLSVEATSNQGEPLGLGASMSGTEITATTTTLYIKSSGNYSDNTAVFRVKYTKTTD